MKELLKGGLTIPNIISFIRILLVPVFVILFLYEHTGWALFVLLLSGLSDMVDGKIARKYNQISELGKILDPAADKLTQIMLAIVLFIEFRNSENYLFEVTSWVFLIFLSKELLMLIATFILLLKKIKPVAARIYGKIATAAFYVVMILIVAFAPQIGIISSYLPKIAIPEVILISLLIATAAMTIVAFIGYGIVIIKQIKNDGIPQNKKNEK